MIAGLVLLSTAVGMAAVATALTLSLPLWVTLVAYPVVCSLTLLLTAALFSLRSGQRAPAKQLLQSQI